MPSGPLTGRLDAPSSKSVTNRLLVIASLATGTSRLTDLLSSDDTGAMLGALRAFGAGIVEARPGSVEVSGTGGALRQPDGPVSAGLSGTTLRFLLGMSLLVRGRVVLDGDPALRRRPLEPLLEALEALGAQIESASGTAPVTITGGGFAGGEVTVDAAASSQFATALLLVAPYAQRDLELTVSNLGASGYVDLTLETMCRWGATAERTGPERFRVAAGRHYRAHDERAVYDASAAAHLYSLAVATGGSVTVGNATESLQPDAGIVEVLAAMGARVSRDDAVVTVAGGDRLTGVEADLSSMPDQVPTIAVVGALADGVTRLTNIAVARGHETDRLEAVGTELRRLGASVEVGADELTVYGGGRLHGGVVETYDDHRMAMAFAALGAVIPGVRIARPGCVTKTYPAFWADARRLGLRLEPSG